MYNRNGKKIPFEYRGTVFIVKEDHHWRWGRHLKIVDIEKSGAEIKFPSQANGLQVKEIDIDKKVDEETGKSVPRAYRGVLKIIIPNGLSLEYLDNANFPDLEEVVLSPSNIEYSTDGKMLYSKNGDELYLVLSAGQNDTVTVPKQVKKLAKNAFRHTLCRNIIFENPNIQAEPNTFDDSVWLDGFKKRDEPVYMGNTFYKAVSNAPVTVKPGTSRFSKEAFDQYVPSELTTPLLPPSNLMREQRFSDGCQNLTLTMENKKINWQTVAAWGNLREIHFTGHNLYKDIDGVVFSKDGRTLLFYPRQKRDSTYIVPDNTRVIARRAFADAKHLKKVSMPDSVTQIYQGAFMCCDELTEVELSDNIAELPDATAFQPEGVFESCYNLKRVHLPQKLVHIGACAFVNCRRLTEIEIPAKVKMIGEYAFRDTGLKQISLPKSLLVIGKGALMFGSNDVPTISAYEGTARGLIGAIEAVEPGFTDGTANMLWRPATIVMLNAKGEVKDKIMVPETLKKASGQYIDIAWNQQKFNYDEYDNCFNDINAAEEKTAIAVKMLSSGRDITDTPYEDYLKRTASKIVERVIETCDEAKVIKFLKYGFLSKLALKKALTLCNNKGLNTAAAYILNLTGEGKIKKEVAIRI